MIYLPLEVVQDIVGYLARDFESLCCSALLSHIFLDAARRLLFHKITLNSGRRCLTFANLISENPRFLSHVRVLELINEGRHPVTSVPDALFDKLNTLISVMKRLADQLDAFGLVDSTDRGFAALPPSLCTAILGLMRSPGLRTARFVGLTSIPLSRLGTCPQLEHLEISHPNVILNRTSRCTSLPSSHKTAKCTLLSLTVTCHHCAVSLRRAFPLKQLRYLAIHNTDFGTLIAVIHKAKNSLERLEFGDLQPGTRKGPRRVNLKNLKSLILRPLPFVPSQCEDLHALVSLLEASHPYISYALEEIILRFHTNDDLHRLLINSAWTRLNFVLQKRYQHVHLVKVEIGNLLSHQDHLSHRKERLTPFWKQVHSIWNLGMLRVSWMGDPVCP